MKYLFLNLIVFYTGMLLVTALIMPVAFARTATTPASVSFEQSRCTDPAVLISLALATTEGDSAFELYKRIAQTDSFPDSVRSIACGRLGDYHCCCGNYDSAVVWYQAGVDLGPSLKLKYRLALASSNAGNDAAAESLWLDLVSDDDGALSPALTLALGRQALKQGRYESADASFRAVESSPDAARFRPVAVYGRFSAALHSGSLDSARALRRLITVKYPRLLERKSVDNAATLLAQPALTSTGKSAIGVSEKGASDTVSFASGRAPAIDTVARFSVQVGSFSSAENARRFCDSLKKKLSSVTMLEAKVGGRQLYRVIVGSFITRDSARSFAETNLAFCNINTYRIIEGNQE